VATSPSATFSFVVVVVGGSCSISVVPVSVTPAGKSIFSRAWRASCADGMALLVVVMESAALTRATSKQAAVAATDANFMVVVVGGGGWWLVDGCSVSLNISN
jgi:hypothetical protein